LDRLADLVPPPRKHRHRYHGVFAPNHKLRPAVTSLAIGDVGKLSQAACCLPLPRGEGGGERASAEGSRHQKPHSHVTDCVAPANREELVQASDDRDVFQVSPDELPVMDIRSL
jgi:hypothetical protein